MTITLRSTKGSRLSTEEMDGNFTHLSNSVPVGIKNYGSDGSALYNALGEGRRVLVPADLTSLTLTLSQVATVVGNLPLIAVEAPITINLPAMDSTLASTVIAASPYGALIAVKGASMASTAITAATNTTPGAGAHEVTFTVTSSAAFTVGGFAFVKSIVGTGQEQVLEGCWEVLAKPSGTSVTLKVKDRIATLPSLAGLSSGTMLAAGTILRFASKVGITIEGGEGPLFQNMVVAGDGAGTVSGVQVFNGKGRFAKSTALPFGVVNFAEQGFRVSIKGTIECYDSYACGNGQSGLSCTDSSHGLATRLVANGNANHGAVSQTGSVIGVSQGTFCGNTQRGVYGSNNAQITATSAVIYHNNDVGVRSDNLALVNVTSAQIAGNTGFGVRAFAGTAITTTADYTGGNGAANESAEMGGVIITSSTAQTHLPLLTPYTVATIPAAATHDFSLIFVSDETGGATIAFSDGTNWRRVQDRTIVS